MAGYPCAVIHAESFREAARSVRVRRLLVAASAVGFLLTGKILLEGGIVTAGGQGGGDAIAYWQAAGHALTGRPIYVMPVGGYAAYLYPPVLAQFLAPVSVLPLPVFVWLWRALEVACLRIAVGSWRNAGLAMVLWPPVVSELYSGNVHLLAAAATAMAIRGDARSVAMAALTKFAAAAAAPAALRVDRRGLALGALAAFVVCLVSIAIAPGTWSSYLAFLEHASEPQSGWFNIGSFVSTPARFVVAAIVSLAAIRWTRLAAVAVTLAFPVLWFHSLSALVAIVAKPAHRLRERVSG